MLKRHQVNTTMKETFQLLFCSGFMVFSVMYIFVISFAVPMLIFGPTPLAEYIGLGTVLVAYVAILAIGKYLDAGS